MRLASLLLAMALVAPASDELFDAARKGDAATVKVALDKGVPVDARWRYDQTALFIASFRGHTEVVRWLLERGARPDVKDTFYAHNSVGEVVMASPALSDGMLFVRTMQHLIAIGAPPR